MKEAFLNNYMKIIQSNKTELSEEEIEKIRYGIEGIYLSITKLVIVFTLARCLGIFKEVIVLLCFYNILRFFGFGYHAETSTQCLIISIILFCLVPYLVIKDIIILKYKLLIFILCVVNFLIFAPADTIKRPLTNKKKRIIRKITLTILTTIMFIISHYVSDNMSALLMLSIITETIMVNPVIYILTGQPFNNYKKIKLN